MREKKTSLVYKLIEGALNAVYPKMEILGWEHLPDEPLILVGNHCQMHGPIAAQLRIPGEGYIWCAWQMMELRQVPAYAYADFWSRKPLHCRWFFRLLSYAVAPLCVCIFNNARTVPVYHDARLVTTFRRSIEKLSEGRNIIIFPEHDVPHNHIISAFQDKFVDVARLYYRKTGKAPVFVPMYISPALRKICFGAPLRYCPENSAPTERRRLCEGLMEEITEMACALPRHRVVPYNNIPRRRQGVNKNEETAGRTEGIQTFPN